MKLLVFKIIYKNKEKILGIYDNTKKSFKKLKLDSYVYISNTFLNFGYYKSKKELVRFMKKEFKKFYSTTFFLKKKDFNFYIEKIELNTLREKSFLSEIVDDSDSESEISDIEDTKNVEDTKSPVQGKITVLSPYIETYKKDTLGELKKPIPLLPLSPLYT